MASAVDVSNMALSHLGSDASVSAIDPPDGSAEAGHCARFYNIARAEILDGNTWAFALKRVALGELATNPSGVWAYAYGMPSDMLSAKRVLNSYDLQTFGFLPTIGGYITPSELATLTERGSAEFTIEGSTLFTHEPSAVLIYTADITDTSRFPPLFVTALSYLLASYIAGPIIRGSEGVKASRELRQIANETIGQAAASDANASSEKAEHVGASIRARL